MNGTEETAHVPAYAVEVLGHGELDPLDDNADVFVYFNDGRKYAATFFTLKNVRTIMERHRQTGESADGSYFWAAECVIVERLDQLSVENAVADLIQTGMFEKAFDGPHPFE